MRNALSAALSTLLSMMLVYAGSGQVTEAVKLMPIFWPLIISYLILQAIEGVKWVADLYKSGQVTPT